MEIQENIPQLRKHVLHELNALIEFYLVNSYLNLGPDRPPVQRSNRLLVVLVLQLRSGSSKVPLISNKRNTNRS